MKKSAIQLFMLSLLIICHISCAKDDHLEKTEEKEENELTADHLSSCPAGADCIYLFAENVDITEGYQMVAGSKLIFWVSIDLGAVQQKFIVKAPMQGDNFELGKADILKGDVRYLSGCPSCNSMMLKPVDGYVKGIKLIPDQAGGQSKWLLAIQIWFGENENTQPVDMVYFKQIFSPNFGSVFSP